MITLREFIPLIRAAVPRFSAQAPNQAQIDCINFSATEPLAIAAGPGSGKSTVLVLRALRLVFVDGLLPEQIVLTTFTRKAAHELRSRLIEWGLLVSNHLRANPPNANTIRSLDSIDVNRFVTGTLDSLCEEALTRYRDPADSVSAVVEPFVANALLARDGIFPRRAHRNIDLQNYLANFTFDGKSPSNFAETLAIIRTIVDRLIHDRVDLPTFRRAPDHTAARVLLADCAEDYWRALTQNNRLDFGTLEREFLDRLSVGRMQRYVAGIRALLIDEYQDTNPLQEAIYFELLRQSGSSLTIVGDDDQSLYRFRGATVELFHDFVSNYRRDFPTHAVPQILYLTENYRSTPEVVQFFNAFIRSDSTFATARVQPPKPAIQAALAPNGYPVLGMFRPDRDTLANDLSQFLSDIFRGNGAQVQGSAVPITINRNVDGGDAGDCVFLGHTINEYAKAFGPQPPRERLPLLLRRQLATRGIRVFNPRGRALRDIEPVQQLLGTILLCIDPQSANSPHGGCLQQLMQNNALRNEAVRNLIAWRTTAQQFLARNPAPYQPHSLPDFVAAWQRRRPQAQMSRWPDEWPLLELAFKIISWIPSLRDDPEGQVYLEAICRVISQSATFSAYRSNLVFNDPSHSTRSVERAISDILAPIAENQVELDEDIIASIPRDTLTVMTIHQAKGLEYPLVIVDVSSDYSTNNASQRFRRFPDSSSNICDLEDDLAPYSNVGALRLNRTALDRTFDDLVRLYYVAYSRPQSVLLLVGLDKCLQYSTPIRHVATQWGRDGSWTWKKNVAGRRGPALANNIPIILT